MYLKIKRQNMKRTIPKIYILALLIPFAIPTLFAQKAEFSNRQFRVNEANRLRTAENIQLLDAQRLARQFNVPLRDSTGELIGWDNNGPVFYETHNVNAAISTGANLIRNVAPYNLNGQGITVGVWDEAKVAAGSELTSRVTIRDGSGIFSQHATHVAGTVAGRGIQPEVMGMAPSTRIDSYSWANDGSEMAAAASATGTDGGLLISNHSYGIRTGWPNFRIAGGVVRYFGRIGDGDEARGFGQYTPRTEEWDRIVHNAPFFLPFKSAGNDRGDPEPLPGDRFVIGTTTNIYDPAIHPGSDGQAGGFDSITSLAIGKNVITVGAARDAVALADPTLRDPARAAVAPFSGWGPADDGRIKPDIVANGVSVLSQTFPEATTVAFPATFQNLSFSGTSMAAPNAAGSAALIQQAALRDAGSVLRASALKGLIIHTADDVNAAGPDYRTGWGLMDAQAAVDLVRDHAQNPSNQRLTDLVLNRNQVQTIRLEHKAAGPIRATICWTDPAGNGADTFDNRTPVLVNDLDLRVRRVGGTTFLPFRLNVNNPFALATRGDNIVDNVEQVFIANAAAGTYEIVISHKGTLRDPSQIVSLVHSGLETEQDNVGVPVIGGNATAAGTVNTFFNYQITATPTPDSYDVVGTLPDGLSFNGNTGRIFGTPTKSGSWTVTLEATLGQQTGTKQLLITIDGIAPVITSGSSASGKVGVPFSFFNRADNDPTAWTKQIATPLPKGLRLKSTGEISGTPEEAGTFVVTVTAANFFGSDSIQLTIVIAPANATVVAQSIPYTQAFNGSTTLPSAAGGWTYTSTNEGRIRVVDRALRLDDKVGNSTFSLNMAELRLRLAGKSNPTLSFRSFRFADENSQMPSSYAGTRNGDGVSISVNGVNWHRIVDFTPIKDKTGWTTHEVNLATAAQAAGITLSNNTRIRFQQYDNYPATLDGRAFDDIEVREIVVAPSVPVITSPSQVNGKVGSFLSYQITADRPVTGYSRQVLPDGLNWNGTKGLISGFPEKAGTYKVRVYALNDIGWGNKLVTFNISSNLVIPDPEK